MDQKKNPHSIKVGEMINLYSATTHTAPQNSTGDKSANTSPQNPTNSKPVEEKALRDQIFGRFANDRRVSQALDPWEMYGLRGRPERHDNHWRRDNLTSGDYFNHRHHLHITVSDSLEWYLRGKKGA